MLKECFCESCDIEIPGPFFCKEGEFNLCQDCFDSRIEKIRKKEKEAEYREAGVGSITFPDNGEECFVAKNGKYLFI